MAQQVALDELRLSDIAKDLAHFVSEGEDTDGITYFAEAREGQLVVTVGTYDDSATREFVLSVRERSAAG